jgi:DNA-binding XRE family transcriptional regulator
MSTIRELRQERGLTQFDLAIEVGVHPQAVYLWESGRRTPLVPQMRKLGELFGLCSDEIALEPRPDTGRSRSTSSTTSQKHGTSKTDAV